MVWDSWKGQLEGTTGRDSWEGQLGGDSGCGTAGVGQLGRGTGQLAWDAGWLQRLAALGLVRRWVLGYAAGWSPGSRRAPRWHDRRRRLKIISPAARERGEGTRAHTQGKTQPGRKARQGARPRSQHAPAANRHSHAHTQPTRRPRSRRSRTARPTHGRRDSTLPKTSAPSANPRTRPAPNRQGKSPHARQAPTLAPTCVPTVKTGNQKPSTGTPARPSPHRRAVQGSRDRRPTPQTPTTSHRTARYRRYRRPGRRSTAVVLAEADAAASHLGLLLTDGHIAAAVRGDGHVVA